MYAFIMAGGIGSRFWPLSREVTPKQLLKIAGPKTMIQQTVNRLERYVKSENVFIITNGRQKDEIIRQLSSGNEGPSQKVIVEPCGRDTAAAVGLAAIHMSAINPDGVMGMFPADHVIKDGKAFIDLIKAAEKIAQKGEIVTLGIAMNKPETGYGYIKKAGIFEKRENLNLPDANAHYVEKFIEKPNLETAKKFFEEKENYFWNSGMFFWTASRILDEIKKSLPELYTGLDELSKSIKKGDEAYNSALKSIYPNLMKISIDKGVMEYVDNIIVIPAQVGWNDVGSWTSLEDILDKDENGNIVEGNVVNFESKNSIIIGSDRVLSAIGLENMIVVDTPDATMICPKNKSQNVKNVVEILQKRGAEECIEHLTVERNWGSYTVLESSDRFKIKKICVKPGARLSRQYHHHRSEHWVVVQGTAMVTKNDEQFALHENESTYIPMSTIHRLENKGILDLHIIEVQNGSYLGEDDIVRLEDDYGRV